MLDDHELMAERAFFLDDDKDRKPALVLRVGAPIQAEGDYPRCRFQLIGSSGVQDMEAPGLDKIDSLLMCLTLAGMHVAGLNESVYGGRLRWEGSPGGGPGLGLPTAPVAP